MSEPTKQEVQEAIDLADDLWGHGRLAVWLETIVAAAQAWLDSPQVDEAMIEPAQMARLVWRYWQQYDETEWMGVLEELLHHGELLCHGDELEVKYE